MKENFSQIIGGEKPVLVDFFATWCGPCQYQAPILEEVSREVGDKARVIKIDVDRNPEIAGKLGIRGVPTLIIFRKGEVKWRASGVKMADELIRLLNEHMN